MLLISGLVLLSCSRPKIVSLKNLLLEMTDRESITKSPSPWYRLKQSGSYDRLSDSAGGKGWYANDDYTQFIGVDSSQGRIEYILLDTEGPGAIVRWWMTFAGEGSYDGIVRVYIDNDKKPVLEENAIKLLSGQTLAGEPLSSSVSPETDTKMRGHNLYLPVPYLKHCRVTFECNAIRITSDSRKPSIYYNIGYRFYEKGTKVVSFSKEELTSNAELINSTNKVLKKAGPLSESIKRYYSTDPISANDSVRIIINSKNYCNKEYFS